MNSRRPRSCAAGQAPSAEGSALFGNSGAGFADSAPKPCALTTLLVLNGLSGVGADLSPDLSWRAAARRAAACPCCSEMRPEVARIVRQNLTSRGSKLRIATVPGGGGRHRPPGSSSALRIEKNRLGPAPSNGLEL